MSMLCTIFRISTDQIVAIHHDPETVMELLGEFRQFRKGL